MFELTQQELAKLQIDTDAENEGAAIDATNDWRSGFRRKIKQTKHATDRVVKAYWGL